VSNLIIRKVAVLGAGVMGAQIAAHLINAKVPVVLFDLPAKEGPKNAVALKAIENLKKLSPAPFGAKDDARYIEPATYEDDIAKLSECDLVIEAIAERMDWKHDLYKKVAPHLAPHAIFAPFDHSVVRRILRRAEVALLRRALLQSAALHASRRADPDDAHAAANPRRSRIVPHERRRQGRRAREGYAELHRQSRRRFLDPRRHHRSREVRPALR
jgi:hypothetical protein